MSRGVAITRGKGCPTKIFWQREYESRADFTLRVVMAFDEVIDNRNTLTIEFVWDADD